MVEPFAAKETNIFLRKEVATKTELEGEWIANIYQVVRNTINANVSLCFNWQFPNKYFILNSVGSFSLPSHSSIYLKYCTWKRLLKAALLTWKASALRDNSVFRLGAAWFHPVSCWASNCFSTHWWYCGWDDARSTAPSAKRQISWTNINIQK